MTHDTVANLRTRAAFIKNVRNYDITIIHLILTISLESAQHTL